MAVLQMHRDEAYQPKEMDAESGLDYVRIRRRVQKCGWAALY